ncbi:hypothetical protein CBR_g3130 [Chara braunii]|uniref:Homologous-pairing protein 2 homolog n=1 Tax=Chara braunii TaxID=69332 RepID=A0A388KEU4_CHABU|nr:hypothetical protein CBR_g3130 [Chara braunii]|eukprot:GBG68585.1 hypothetical protein CBR_g3130 [Chara braunii]
MEEIVLNYMNAQNRPLNVQNVADALQKHKIKKTAVQKLLDSLADKNAVSFKDYGKQRIYVARQDQFEIPSTEEMETMRAYNEKLQDEIAAIKSTVAGLESDMRSLESNLTSEEIQKKTKVLTEENKQLEAKLIKLREGTVLITDEEKAKIEEQYTKMISHWRKRKRIFKDLWGMITENMTKKPSEFKEEVGIETDEDAGVSIEDYSDLVNKGPKMTPKRRKMS